MTDETLLILGIVHLLTPLLVVVAVVWLYLRTGHGVLWVILAFLPFVGQIFLATRGAASLSQGGLTEEQYVVLSAMPDVATALLLLVLAAKAWPRYSKPG